MLELRSASKVVRVGTVTQSILRDVDLHIGEGEMLAIMGPSGAGKSTLLNVLGCLDELDEGQYFVKGAQVHQRDRRALAHLRNQTFGFVFQFFGLISEYSALENVMLPLIYRKTQTAKARQKALHMLEEIGIAPLYDKRPHEMSGGQQQRVAIARALVGQPSVILADEPTGSLDSASGAAVLDLLAERNRQGHTVVIVTHSEEVSSRCSRVLWMRDGCMTDTPAVTGALANR